MSKGIESKQDTVQEQPIKAEKNSVQEQILDSQFPQKSWNKKHKLGFITGSLLLLVLSLVTFNQASSTQNNQAIKINHNINKKINPDIQ
jgi:hypothetical protein